MKLTNLVTKEDFNNFTSVIEQKITSGPNFIKECGKETFADIDDLNLLKNESTKKFSDQLAEVQSMISELSAITKKKKSVTECNKTSITECTKNLDQVSENFSNSNPSYCEVVKKSPISSKIEKNSPFKDISTIMKNGGHWNPQSKNLKPKKLYEGKLKGSKLISVAKLGLRTFCFVILGHLNTGALNFF